MSSDITDFNTYSHSALRKMVHALNSGDVMAASDPWRRAAETLKQIRAALDAASNTATDNWQGNSSNAFYDKMTTLANNVNNTASYANDAANTLQMMSEAIDQAKHDMPEEPGFWAQVGNAISDTAQNAVGIQDDSTQTPIKDQKKAEAVAVMQTLANKYRTATPVLKPPAINNIDESNVPPPDQSASAALTAFVMGAGLGAVGGHVTAPENTRAVSIMTDSQTSSSRARSAEAAASSDFEIKGGIANPAPKPSKSTAIGADTPGSSQEVHPVAESPTSLVRPQIVSSGTGLAGAGATGSKTPHFGAVGAPGNAVAGGTASGGPLSMGFGGSAGRSFATDSRAFAGGSVEQADTGRPSGYLRGGATREGNGGEIGGGEMVGGRAVGGPRDAFTEGGTGLGAQGRMSSEAGAEMEEMEERGPGFLLGETQQARRKKRREGKRPDYLVEDEETWMADEAVNPSVVE
ncbi:WXG100 family type VII secretion target [Kitasatospora sp. NBC_01266]|uniref:WXG100 family type VII secretion target n=1 Tax=Kitasatospora sp. NBC_01266 TaxID=2903572 RepID=UPI002E36F2E5|nr:WXG100 family type VII secretion target [Kitasatospora sp. NBC_01266]